MYGCQAAQKAPSVKAYKRRHKRQEIPAHRGGPLPLPSHQANLRHHARDLYEVVIVQYHPEVTLHGRHYPGTSIGLAIVRKGVERMGGKAGVESESGKGSRFWLDLQPASE